MCFRFSELNRRHHPVWEVCCLCWAKGIHGHGVRLQGRGGKFFVGRRGDSDFLSREGVSFCPAGGGNGGREWTITKTVLIFPPLFYKTKASVLKQVFVSVFWLVIQEKMRF